jgi:hypothetical protein
MTYKELQKLHHISKRFASTVAEPLTTIFAPSIISLNVVLFGVSYSFFDMRSELQ